MKKTKKSKASELAEEKTGEPVSGETGEAKEEPAKVKTVKAKQKKTEKPVDKKETKPVEAAEAGVEEPPAKKKKAEKPQKKKIPAVEVQEKPAVQKEDIKPAEAPEEAKPVRKTRKPRVTAEKPAAAAAAVVEKPKEPPVEKKKKIPAPHAVQPEVKHKPEQAPVQAPVIEEPPKPKEPVKPPEPPKPPAPRIKVKINELTTVRELAEKMGKPVVEIITKLLSLGVSATINQRIEQDVAELIANEYNADIEFVPLYEQEDIKIEEDSSKMASRAPIVTVMGHVDHGKTTLLDTIRKANVTASEAGGITQHIGAYKVHTPKGDIVFLDTPGHELFTAMRAHGAKITDIVVLVVGADDGVMPQTVEAINHARSGGVPIIVAINKIDMANANPEKVKQQLSTHNLIADSWGGDTLTVEISARNNINIDKLLEAILFKAELMDLKTNVDTFAQGMVVEAKLDPRKGALGTVLVQKGTLKVGDNFICGMTYGKVKALINDVFEKVNSAGPSTPVEVLGFSGMPSVGDMLVVVKDMFLAKDVSEKRMNMIKLDRMKPIHRVKLDEIKSANIKKLNLIIKADVSGSLGALRDGIDRITSNEVQINIVNYGVGVITESDVNLAITTDSVIIGFNVRSEPGAETLAKQQDIEIRTYRIIYELLDEIKKALEGLLEPKFKEVIIGKVQVRKVFQITGVGPVAGSFVAEGKVQTDAKARVLRDNAVVADSKISSIRRFKDNVKEVDKGFECGITLANFSDYKAGDILEIYIQEKIASKLV